MRISSFIEETINGKFHFLCSNDHVTGKYRGSVYKDCNINLRLNKKSHVKFHDLTDYDSHLIMPKIGKFDVKIGKK